jgi:hypothetical protein
MKKRFRILLMALLLVCCLILSGCGQLKNEVLEGQMSAMVTVTSLPSPMSPNCIPA